jgi:hypothetical protein
LNCSTERGGGGGMGIGDPSLSFSVKNSLFHKCRAELWGGGISFYNLSLMMEEKIILFFLFF